MRKIKTIREDEMIAAFLYAELQSPRSMSKEIQAYLQRDGMSPRVILSPDLHNERENAYRRAVLGAYRGYGQGREYFQGFPEEMRWERVGLTRQELEPVKYIEYDYWVELSGGSRLARDGARRALAGIDVFGLSSQYFVDIAEALRQGAQFPTLIFVGRDEASFSHEGPVVGDPTWRRWCQHIPSGKALRPIHPSLVTAPLCDLLRKSHYNL